MNGFSNIYQLIVTVFEWLWLDFLLLMLLQSTQTIIKLVSGHNECIIEGFVCNNRIEGIFSWVEAVN